MRGTMETNWRNFLNHRGLMVKEAQAIIDETEVLIQATQILINRLRALGFETKEITKDLMDNKGIQDCIRQEAEKIKGKK